MNIIKNLSLFFSFVLCASLAEAMHKKNSCYLDYDYDQPGQDGMTVLHRACYDGPPQDVSDIICRYPMAMINQECSEGLTPLDYAAMDPHNGYQKSLILLKNNAVITKTRRTPNPILAVEVARKGYLNTPNRRAIQEAFDKTIALIRSAAVDKQYCERLTVNFTHNPSRPSGLLGNFEHNLRKS